MNNSNFEFPVGDKDVQLCHIFNSSISCYITNYGARIVSLNTLDAQSNMVDVVLGFDSLEGYLNASEQYHGATIGRYANRIANGSFVLNEKEYTLAQNNGANSLHGGINAFHNQVWNVIEYTDVKVVLELTSPHMEEGFPGHLITQVTYSIEGSTLKIDYKATTSEETVVNFTHHSYFNLNGEGSGSTLNHLVKINAEYYTPLNRDTIPLGPLNMVSDTPFDFTVPKTIGRDIEMEDEQLEIGNGYDHNFVLNQYIKGDLNLAAFAVGDVSGIKMEVWTTEPGIQFYTASHLDGSDVGKSNVKYGSRHAFCFETQHFPDSPNHSHFPSTILKTSETFESCTEYRFSVV